MLVLDPDGDLEAIAGKMTKALASVKTGEITRATRSVEIDGVKVQEGQVIALLDGKLVASTQSVEESMLNLLNKAKAEEHELVTLIYGEDVSRGEADRIVDKVREIYPSLEMEVQDGGQPNYQFIVSIE
jgi:hypothetical protein